MARYVDIECDSVTEVIDRRAFKSRNDIQDFLDNIPTADVQEVKHGKWVWEDYRFRCSICDSTIPKVTTDNKTFINETYKYCRWCGAKMDGGKNE